MREMVNANLLMTHALAIPPQMIASPVLRRRQIHLWTANLDQPEEMAERYAQTLSTDEWTRARRFRFARHRDAYVVRRGILRTLLGQYLDSEARSIRFEYGAWGKPELAKSKKTRSLTFNLSHSGHLALYAFLWDQEVGIDIERVHPIPDAEAVSKRFFSARENAAWLGLPAEQRTEGFFNCWTRKEAFIKARGVGLSYPLDRFDVSLRPGEPSRLLAIEGNRRTAADWLLKEFSPTPDYVAALAIEGLDWQIRVGWVGEGSGDNVAEDRVRTNTTRFESYPTGIAELPVLH